MTKTEAINKTRESCRLKHLALSTESNYCHWIGKFFDWMATQAKACALLESPKDRMEGFLNTMAGNDYSASTQNQAFSALLYFYRNIIKTQVEGVNALRAKRPQRMRFSPSRQQVAAVLSCVEDSPTYPWRLIVFLLYGCGLRVSEPLNIRFRDIDLANRRLIVREAKGNKDRLVKIPSCLVDPLAAQMEAARAVWQRAQSEGVPVKLPHRLRLKYRRHGNALAWWWIFPAGSSCTDPRTEKPVWWHALPSGVQKALRKAGNRAGLPSLITPHHLRHAWATHAADQGASLRDLQEILGHKSLETTMGYAHPQIERVESPLDSLSFPTH